MTDNKEMYLAEWDTYNDQVCDVLDAIDQLTDKKHPFAVSLLAGELVKITEARHEALGNLKQYGINNNDDALFEVCKWREKKAEEALQ